MSRSRVLTSRFRERVLVTTKAGDTFDGVLYSGDDKLIVLKSASAVGAGENSTNLPLDGEILVYVADVSHIQRP